MCQKVRCGAEGRRSFVALSILWPERPCYPRLRAKSRWALRNHQADTHQANALRRFPRGSRGSTRLQISGAFAHPEAVLLVPSWIWSYLERKGPA